MRDLRGSALVLHRQRQLAATSISSPWPSVSLPVGPASWWPSPTSTPWSRRPTAIDEHAAHNTTSVYTAAQIFPMLPEKLSTGLTSLNPEQERLAVVFDMVVAEDGSVEDSGVYRALVSSRAKLAYNSVAAWLDGIGPEPAGDRRGAGLADNLRLQDRVAQAMQNYRHVRGALSLQTIEAKPVFEGDLLSGIEVRGEEPGQGHHRGLHDRGERRGRPLPGGQGIAVHPPGGADTQALGPHRRDGRRSTARGCPARPIPWRWKASSPRPRAKDPVRFPDLSLAIIKLLGPGEYVAEMPGRGHGGPLRPRRQGLRPFHGAQPALHRPGHPAAAQGRAWRGGPLPTTATSSANSPPTAPSRRTRPTRSSARWASPPPRCSCGRAWGSSSTAWSPARPTKGTWVRLLQLPVEGRVVEGFRGLDVGDRVRVQLVDVDVERGFIDFRRVGGSRQG